MFNSTMEPNKEDVIIRLNDDVKVDFRDWEKGDYPLHYHDHFEMEIVTSGNGSQLFNGKEIKLEKGDIFLMRPLDFHKIHSDEIGFVCVNIKPTIVPKWITTKLQSIKNPVVCHLSDEDFETFISITKTLQKEMDNENEESFLIKTAAVNLILSLFLQQAKNDVFNDDVVSKIIYYLQKDYRFTKKVSLDEIANYVGYSKYYTSAVFHKKYGITIQDFIINLKIEYAKKLLLETNYSIDEIIAESGFSSTSNFYSIFLKTVGCTPLKFRKRNKL